MSISGNLLDGTLSDVMSIVVSGVRVAIHRQKNSFLDPLIQTSRNKCHRRFPNFHIRTAPSSPTSYALNDSSRGKFSLEALPICLASETGLHSLRAFRFAALPTKGSTIEGSQSHFGRLFQLSGEVGAGISLEGQITPRKS